MTSKVRILKGRNRPAYDKHDWQQPWPAAVARQCARCGAWMVPLLVRDHGGASIDAPSPSFPTHWKAASPGAMSEEP
jgi:hypothetical protein